MKNIMKNILLGASILLNITLGLNGVHTIEDYQRYEQYKQNLISEHGKEVYELMNQEAGIKNEQQSFEHFMKYGI